MSEQRTPYGIPIPGALDRVDPIGPLSGPDLEPIQPLDYADPADEEPETWRDELPDNQRLVYDAVLRRVTRSVQYGVRPDYIVWLVEETLWQLGRLWRDLGPNAMDIPGIGAVQRGPAGRPLRREDVR